MKKALSVAALALAMTGSALAADLPHYKAPPPPPPPPPPMWTGFYVGLNAGGTWAQSNSVNVISFPMFAQPGFGVAAISPIYASLSALGASGVVSGGNSSGFIGGGQIGYNWQFYNSFVAGIEADIQGVATGGGNNATTSALIANAGFGLPAAPSVLMATTLSSTKRLDYIGTVRGRLGWLFTPTLLAYGTGGLAYGGVSVNTSIAQFNNEAAVFPAGLNAAAAAFGTGAFSDTRVGWTVGGGLEWMFWPNWSAKVEYLYYDLGNVSYAVSPMATLEVTTPFVYTVVGSQARTRFNGNIVRAGVNYHFNWGAPPVVAKY